MKLNQKNLTVSPEVYIKTKMKDLPFGMCYSSHDTYEKSGHFWLNTFIVSRIMPSGKLIVGMYLIDMYCLGVKNTAFHFAMTSTDFNELVKTVEKENSLK